ncbi:MAG: HDOD domain-containing protein [Candidatus Krumholzibacteriota bacterium]|nr:HDOD domain-containing protein [Candidatus Krumholzibacteriota bacterium]
MTEIFVGRQPIFDKKLNVIGYELLYRASEEDLHACITDNNDASSQVILNTFMSIGLERLAGDRLVFINLSEGFFRGDFPFPLDPEKIVVEILEGMTLDKSLVDSIRDFAARGYRLALDDVVDIDHISNLIDIAEIAKIDIRQIRPGRLVLLVEKLKERGLKIVAEKIETMAEYEYCYKLGVDYFQGFFFEKPNTVKGKRMPSSSASIMRLLARLHDPDVTVTEIKEIISHDVSISYKLLRLMNSASFSLSRKIESIHEAVVMFGFERIRSWLSLLLLSKIEESSGELMTVAMIRGKMCEIITEDLDPESAERGFITGLFSVLDALLSVPMGEILPMLPLADEIKDALLIRKGFLGNSLASVIAHERWEWNELGGGEISEELLNSAYLRALDWTTEILAGK